MTGRWTAAIARRVLRPSTFEAIAMPAIADLQVSPCPSHRS
jgi:stage V sporulation protein SpoVS